MSTIAASPITPPTAISADGIAGARARHGACADRWLEAMWRGDPLADAVVADFAHTGHARGMAMFRAALAHGIESVDDAPESLTALFAALDAPPAWLDRRRLDRAAEHLARQAREFHFVLAAASLPAGAGNAIAGRPLTFTGRYTSQAAVRSLEVGSWLVGVLTPGGMGRHAPGFEQTARVRLIHAMVRARLDRHADWDLAAWGRPIPQPHMVFTLAEFGSIALRSMHRLGVRYTPAELDDIYHVWRYVGRLIGIEDELNPIDEADHLRAEELYALTGSAPERDDQEFVAALTAFQAEELARRLPGPLRRAAPGFIHGAQRAFIGDAAADALAIPDSAFKHAPRLLAPLAAAGYRAYDAVVPDGRARRTKRAFRFRAEELARMRADHGIAHQLVDDAPTAAAAAAAPR